MKARALAAMAARSAGVGSPGSPGPPCAAAGAEADVQAAPAPMSERIRRDRREMPEDDMGFSHSGRIQPDSAPIRRSQGSCHGAVRRRKPPRNGVDGPLNHLDRWRD
jgi:hypothetical protein